MKKDKTERSWSDSTAKGISFSRRDFLKTVGGGIILFFFAGALPAQQRVESRLTGQELPTDFNAFLRIGADGRVSCFTGKVELGQGVVTSLAQMLADELDVPLDRVDMIMGDTDLCPWDMGTFGSRSTRFFGPPLREAAAEARSILLALAAESLKISQNRLIAKNGVISDTMNSEKKISYQELTKGKHIERHLTSKPPLKKLVDFKVMGKSQNRVDSTRKVSGEARYAGDIRLPGMLYAKIVRPPAHGARIKRFDISALKDIEDVRVVEDKDFIAVLHPYHDIAEKALSLLKAEFEIPENNLDNTTIHKHLLDVAPKDGEVVSEGGDLKEGERLAAQTFEETYFDHYVAHAAMETHTATAKFEQGKITVWASTQTPFRGKEEVAQVLGIPVQKVRFIAPFVGGGFGGKSFNLQAVEAARLAKMTGRPVQVMWSRKEEFFNDTFRPASIIKIKSGLDDAGKIIFWQYDVYYAGSRGAEQIYTVPHHRETSYVYRTGVSGAHPFATGPWRAPGNNSNTFARESHIDIMAAKLKMDPLEFRMKNLTDKRMLNTLKAAAAQFGWKPAAADSGRGCGIACASDAGACVATMAQVDVNRGTGKVVVKRIVCAQDMGFVVNPEGAKLQMEGGLMMGLGYALTEEINFKGGRILDDNFDTYEIPHFSWLPKIETILIENPEYPAQGGGEPPVTCVGAVIANAIFDSTGARLYRMPMTPARVKEALDNSSGK